MHNMHRRSASSAAPKKLLWNRTPDMHTHPCGDSRVPGRGSVYLIISRAPVNMKYYLSNLLAINIQSLSLRVIHVVVVIIQEEKGAPGPSTWYLIPDLKRNAESRIRTLPRKIHRWLLTISHQTQRHTPHTPFERSLLSRCAEMLHVLVDAELRGESTTNTSSARNLNVTSARINCEPQPLYRRMMNYSV